MQWVAHITVINKAHDVSAGEKGVAWTPLLMIVVLLAFSTSSAFACGCDDDESDNICYLIEVFDPATGECVVAPTS